MIRMIRESRCKLLRYGTLKEAIAAGYTKGRTAFERGYISRRTEINDNTVVYISGRGELFYYLPARCTSRYCVRQYLSK